MLILSWKGVQQWGTASERLMTLFLLLQTLSNTNSKQFAPQTSECGVVAVVDGTRDGTLKPLALDSRRGTPHTKTSILSLKRSWWVQSCIRPPNDFYPCLSVVYVGSSFSVVMLLCCCGTRQRMSGGGTPLTNGIFPFFSLTDTILKPLGFSLEHSGPHP